MKKQKRVLNVVFNSAGSESVSPRVIIPAKWFEEMGITPEEREIKVSYDSEKKQITMEKIEQLLKNNEDRVEKFLVVYNKEDFDCGTWKNGTVTLGLRNKKATLIKPGDIIFMYLKTAELKGYYRVLDQKKWKIVEEKNFETEYQFENGYDFQSENQFTMEPILVLENSIDFREIVEELSFTSGRGSSWGIALRGYGAVQLLNYDDSDFLENIIKKEYENQN